MRKYLWLIGLFLIGCAGMTPQQQSYLNNTANRPIYCQAGEECEVMWGQATQWILQNSYWKIHTQSENMIQTEGPLNTVYAAYQVQRVPLGNGRYEIVMQLGCGNPFGCFPSLLELKANFVQYVTAYQAPVSNQPISNNAQQNQNEPITVNGKVQICEAGHSWKYSQQKQEWECIKNCAPGAKLVYSEENKKWECEFR